MKYLGHFISNTLRDDKDILRQCGNQGSYRKCVIKFKNIQEHLRGKIEHFQEHSQEHFMYNKKCQVQTAVY